MKQVRKLCVIANERARWELSIGNKNVWNFCFCDEKYKLERHFGVDLASQPNYRSIHVVESRYTDCPQHIQTNMYGGINLFTPLNY